MLTDFEHIFKGDEQKPLRRKVGKWAATLLIIGLAVELSALARTNQLFDMEINDTNNRAVDAFGKAKTASDDARSAFNRAKDASDKATAAEKEAGENKLEAEKLRLRAENEAVKRVAIEQQLAWRTLSKMQEKILGTALPPELVGTKLLVGDVMGDAEGDSYAAEIWGALSKAGWGDTENVAARGVGNPISLYFPSVPAQGLQIAERDREQAGRFLQATFKKAGIDVDMLLVPVTLPDNVPLLAALAANLPVGTLKLTVGIKPKKKHAMR